MQIDKELREFNNSTMPRQTASKAASRTTQRSKAPERYLSHLSVRSFKYCLTFWAVAFAQNVNPAGVMNGAEKKQAAYSLKTVAELASAERKTEDVTPL